MVTVQIGGTGEQDLTSLDEGWVLQQIARRRADDAPVCLQVRIVKHPLSIHLATPDCPTSGGGRQPNSAEAPILELWIKCGLNQPGFPPGRVIEFLRRLQRLL